MHRIAVGSMATFEPDLESFHQRLVADGWRTHNYERGTISGRLNEYWVDRDPSYRKDLRTVPEAEYHKYFDEPASTGSAYYTLKVEFGDGSYTEGNLFDPYADAAVAPPYPDVAPDQYALLLSLGTNYFNE